jgi:hypothetical protein
MVASSALLAMIAGVAALATAAPSTPDVLARWRSGEAVPHLEVRLTLEGAGRPLALADGPAGAREHAPPPCIPELCPARVEIPGVQVRTARPSRTELFATLLDRAGVEPFATIAWAFVATGVRVDWSPPTYDAGDPAAAHGGGWGSLFVRLKLRIDATNRPTIPPRHKHGPERSWSALMTPRV